MSVSSWLIFGHCCNATKVITILDEWNLIAILVAPFLMSYYYIKSVSPAALEEKIGEGAYEKCGRYRIIAGAFEFLLVVNYVIYFFFPVALPIPQFIPWHYLVTLTISLVILVPSLYLMLIGVKDAGEETLRPVKGRGLYGGIYEKIRHPQALGESWLFLVIGLMLNSLLLALWSCVWFPIYYYLSKAEERDLIIRYGQSYLDYMDRTGMFFPRRKSKEVS